MKTGASVRPMEASMLCPLSLTGLKPKSKDCSTQTTSEAKKIMVKAFCKKSRAFSQISWQTLRAEGKR